MKRGYCAVAADIVHHGHIKFVQACAKQCDYLIVGVMTDEAIEKYKGEKPIMYFDERVGVISQIGCVKVSTQAHNFDHFKYVRAWLAPDIIFDSEEHRGKREGADVYIQRTEGISSREIKERVVEDFNNSKRKNKRRFIRRR